MYLRKPHYYEVNISQKNLATLAQQFDQLSILVARAVQWKTLADQYDNKVHRQTSKPIQEFDRQLIPWFTAGSNLLNDITNDTVDLTDHMKNIERFFFSYFCLDTSPDQDKKLSVQAVNTAATELKSAFGILDQTSKLPLSKELLAQIDYIVKALP